MLRWIYNQFFPFVFLALLPGYLWRMIRRGDYRAHFGQRLGWYAPELRDRLAGEPRRLWLQAVSVGEMLIALKLVAALRAQTPDLPLILSTTTTTGFRLAQARVDANVEVIYSPIDLRSVVRRSFRVLRPAAVVIVDGGLWPNQLWTARRQRIPTVLVNARLSPRSERQFRRFNRFSRQLFSLLDLVCVPEESDISRWQNLGVSAGSIHCTGSIKYDDQDAVHRADPDRLHALLASIGVLQNRRILLAGSTHAGEEKLIANALSGLRQTFPDLFTIIAPRHVERTAEILAELKPFGLRIVRRTSMELPLLSSTLVGESTVSPDVLLLDTTGELRDWYSVATIVFIGKSLEGIGGQNPAEAISAGKAVVVGPRMENFQELIRALLKADAICQIASASELEPMLHQLLNDDTARAEMARKAGLVLAKHRGAATRTAELLARQGKLPLARS